MEGLQEFVGQMTWEPCLQAFCLCHLPVSSSHNAFAYFGGYFSILSCYYVPSLILPRTLSLIFLISSELLKNLKWHGASDFTVFFGEWRRGTVQSKTVAHAKYVLPGSTHPPWLLDEFAACAGPHPGVPHCWLRQAYMHRSNSPGWHGGTQAVRDLECIFLYLRDNNPALLGCWSFQPEDDLLNNLL